jgi:hypothetical protein
LFVLQAPTQGTAKCGKYNQYKKRQKQGNIGWAKGPAER